MAGYMVIVSEKRDVVIRAIAKKRGITPSELVQNKLDFYLSQEVRNPEELLSEADRAELGSQVEALKTSFLELKLVESVESPQ